MFSGSMIQPWTLSRTDSRLIPRPWTLPLFPQRCLGPCMNIVALPSWWGFLRRDEVYDCGWRRWRGRLGWRKRWRRRYCRSHQSLLSHMFCKNFFSHIQPPFILSQSLEAGSRIALDLGFRICPFLWKGSVSNFMAVCVEDAGHGPSVIHAWVAPLQDNIRHLWPFHHCRW